MSPSKKAAAPRAAGPRAMAKLWSRLEGWLKRHLAELAKDLNPGASDRKLATLEKKLGQALPDDVKAFYRRHDGQKGKAPTGPFFGLDFLSLAGMLEHWQGLTSADPTLVDGLSENARSHPPGCIKTVYASRGWIPFSQDHGGNYLGIDLDPGPAGTPGQVINFGRDEDKKFVLAPSFGQFIAWLVDELEGGNFAIQVEHDGGRSFNIKRPKARHFLSQVPALFGGRKQRR